MDKKEEKEHVIVCRDCLCNVSKYPSESGNTKKCNCCNGDTLFHTTIDALKHYHRKYKNGKKNRWKKSLE